MLNSGHEIAEKYAQALFDLAEEEKISDKVKDDIGALAAVFQENAELKAFLANPGVVKEARVAAVKEIFTGKIEAVSLKFILLLVDKRFEGLLPLIAKNFGALLNEKEGKVEARVTTARELSANECESITERLTKMFNKPVVLDRHIEPGIIGGIIIQVGDKLIDGSISYRLKKYEDLLCRVNVEGTGVAKSP